MLERFKRTGSDRSPSGAVATSERTRDEEMRAADGTEEHDAASDPHGRARVRDTDAETRPMESTEATGSADDDTTAGSGAAGAARAGDATRPMGRTGAADGDAHTVDDRLAAEREARRRERESRRAGRTQRRDGAAGAAMRDDDTTGTAVRDDDTTGTAVRDDDTTGTTVRDDDTTGTTVRDDGTTRTAVRDDDTAGTSVRDDGGDRTVARGSGAAAAAGTVDGTSGRTVTRGGLTGEALRTARARQRDEFGGLNWGSSFFGWLVAIGVAALITGLLAAMGAAIGLTTQDADVDSLGLGGGIALLAALMLAYFCGGYVAGRMSRFDGARQGAGVWIIAFVVTVAVALLAILAGDKYNVLAQLGLPSIPVGSSELRSGGWIALLAVVVGTFVAAVVGGKWGERYHRRVDRAAFID